MQKRTLILITTLLLILIGGFAAYYFLFLKNPAPAGTSDNTDFPNPDVLPQNTGSNGNNGTTNTPGASEGDVFIPRLRQLSNVPIAGESFFEKKGELKMRFLERGTGHIAEASTTALEIKRLSNTTIPKIYEALFALKGQAMLIRFLKEDTETIQTFYASLIPPGKNSVSSTTMELQGQFLANNIKSVAVSPLGNKIFYLSSNGAGGTIGTLANQDGTKKLEIFRSPLREWNISWNNDTTLALTTKPSASADGYLYFLNSKTEKFEKILGGIPGLTALVSPDQKKILYSKSTRDFFNLYIYEVASDRSEAVSIQTLPEKCVWSKKETDVLYCAIASVPIIGQYPDIWYQGIASFNDELWKINIVTGQTERVLAQISNQPFDMTDLKLSTDESHLMFINKKDLMLWVYRLVEQSPNSKIQ